MKLKMKRISLALEFAILGTVILMLALSLCLWFTRQFYIFYEEKLIQNLEAQGGRIERTFTDVIDHTSDMMHMLNTQIRHNSKDLKYIENIITKFKSNSVVENTITWTYFSWLNEKHQLVVDSMYGILQDPMDLAHRDYLPMTIKIPEKIHLGSPAWGTTSKCWMIPGGIGVLDKQGNYIGTMTIGFDISALVNKLKVAINNDAVGFVLIDQHLNVIFKSSDKLKEFKDNQKISQNKLLSVLKSINFLKTDKQIYSYKNVLWTGENYYIFKFAKYPYVLYLTYDNNIIKNELWSNLFLRIIEVFLTGLILLLLLLLIYYQIIKPLIALSDTADKISKGENISKIARGRFYETANLALQLLKLKRSISREKRAKEQLSKTIEIAESSDKEREEFVQRVKNETIEPLNTIMNQTKLLLLSLEDDKKNTSSLLEHKISSLKTIYEAAVHLKDMTSNVLNFSYVSIPTLINKCITIHAKAAYARNINLKVEIESNIPDLYADEIKFTQIIVRLLSRAMEFSPHGSIIEIFISTEFNNIRWLIIKIKDNSFGLNGKDRERIKQTYKNDSFTINEVNSVTVTIEKLVHLHNGRLVYEDIYGKGSTVTLYIPYNDNHAKNINSSIADNIVPIFGQKIIE